MNIVICDTNRDFCKEVAGLTDELEIANAGFEQLDGYLGPNACVTNAGNGLGIMGAGMAGAIQKYFGTNIQHDARAWISRNGLPASVGTSFIVETGPKQSDYRWCAYTVTMEQPGTVLDPEDGIPYDCMSATLQAAENWNESHLPVDQIKTLVIPGFGGGIGGLDPYSIAVEMVFAFEDYFALQKP